MSMMNDSLRHKETDLSRAEELATCQLRIALGDACA